MQTALAAAGGATTTIAGPVAMAGYGVAACATLGNTGPMAISATSANQAVTALILTGANSGNGGPGIHIHDTSPASSGTIICECESGPVILRSNASYVTILTGGDYRYLQTTTLGTFYTRVEAPRFTAAPITTASTSGARTFDLSASQNQTLGLAENVTITVSNAVKGGRGYFEFTQPGASPKTVTMPADGATVTYGDDLKALVLLNTLVEVTAGKTTLLLYEVINSGRVYVYGRSTNTIPA